MTGTSIAQLIPLLLTPVLTRLFSPEEFGIFNFFMPLVTFLSVIGAGRYEQAIVLPKKDKDAINILALCLIILTAYVGVLSIVFLLFRKDIATLINVESINGWLWFIPICVFLTVGYRIFTYWSNRKKRFLGTSGAVVSLATARATTQISGGLIKFSAPIESKGFVEFFKSIFKKTYVIPSGITTVGVSSLILSYAIGLLFGVLLLLFPFLKKDRALFSNVSKSGMREQAKIYKKFPRINTWHAFGDELKNMGVNSTLIYGFGEVILGFYGMTYRILRAPLAVIGNSFAQVFFQKAAEMHANGQNFVKLVDSTVKKLTLVAVPIFATILIFGPDLFDFVLGDKWRVAGVYAQYLTPWLFLSFVVAPVQQAGVILNKQGQLFMFSLLGNFLIFGSILIGAFLLEDILKGFLMLSILQIGYYIWVFLWIRSISKKLSGKV